MFDRATAAHLPDPGDDEEYLRLQSDLMDRLISRGEARRLDRTTDVEPTHVSFDGDRVEARVKGSRGDEYDTRITLRPRPGHKCSCTDWAQNGIRVGPCKHVLRLGYEWRENVERKIAVLDFSRTAAQVGTDTATILAISPEGLHRVIEDGEWESTASAFWDEGASYEDSWAKLESLIREHGGAWFETKGDGAWDVEVEKDGFPDAEGRGYKAPYGTPDYGASKVASAYQQQVVLRNLKSAGWWRIEEDGRMAPPLVDKGGLQNAVPGSDPDDARYNGDGPADLMGAALAEVDLAYRAAWDRPATPEELRAVFEFVFRPVEDGSFNGPYNLWVDAAVEAFEVPSHVILSLESEAQALAKKLWREYEHAEAAEENPDQALPGEKSSDQALDEFLDHIGASLWLARRNAEALVEHVPEGHLTPDKDAVGDVVKTATSNHPTKLAMFDFDGTLFNSEERNPEWWTKPGQYSWGSDPRSLEPPCVPERPEGSAYWNMKVVQAAREASTDPQTHLVLVTGRLGVHEPRIRELLTQQGIRPDGFYFNRGGSAATFKKRVFGSLFIKFPTMMFLDIWENENQEVYGQFVRRLEQELEHDIELEVHHVSEKMVPAACGPTDFPGEVRVAAANTRGVGLFIPVPKHLAHQFPSLGGEDTSPPHVTLLYVGPVPKERQEEFKVVVSAALKREPGPVRARLGEPDFFAQPEKGRRVWYSRVTFSKDMAEVRDRAWLALEDAGFEVQHAFPFAFTPHVTLAYVEGDVHSHDRWRGVEPRGVWEFSSIEVWGLPGGVMEVPMGVFESGTAPSPARVASRFWGRG